MIPPQTLAALSPAIQTAVKYLLGIGATVAAYILISKFITAQKRRNQLAQFDNAPSVKSAMLLKQAINPSGNDWMQSFDGTNEAKLLQAGKEAESFSDVATSYRKLGYGDLDEDLRSELDNEDYVKFLASIKKEGKNTIIETPYKYAVGQTVAKKIDTDISIMRVISNNVSNELESLDGSKGNEWPMTILSRGHLTITNLDSSKRIENFYKVRFDYKGFFGNSIKEGWINSKYLRTYTGTAMQDPNAKPFKYRIGQTVYKNAGTIRLKEKLTISNSLIDTLLSSEDNGIKMIVIATDRLQYKASGQNLVTNYYKVRFETDGWLFNKTVELWTSGGSLSPFPIA